MKKVFNICKIIKYLFATWANALIVTCLKMQSFGLQIIIKEYEDYIAILSEFLRPIPFQKLKANVTHQNIHKIVSPPYLPIKIKS